MSSKDDEISVKISANSSTVKPGMDAAAAAVQEAAAAMREAMGGVGEMFERLNGVMAAAMAVLAGGAYFKEAVSEAAKFNGESMKLAKTLGITTEEASALNIALGDIYSDAGTYADAAQKLTRQVRTNEQALNDMGLKTRDAHGHLRNMQDMMMGGIAILRGYQEGADRNAAAQVMFGRGAGDMSSLLKLNSEVLEEARKKQEELSMAVGPESAKAVKEYKAAMNDAHDVVDALNIMVGRVMMPSLTEMAKWFSSVGPTAVQAMKASLETFTSATHELKASASAVFSSLKSALSEVLEALQGVFGADSQPITGMQVFRNSLALVEAGFVAFRVGVETAINLIKHSLQELVDTAGAAAAAVNAALHGDTEGAKRVWSDYKENAKRQLQAFVDEGVKIAEKGRGDIDAALLKPYAQAPAYSAETETIQAPEGKRYDIDAEKKNAGGDTRLAEWKSQLEQRKEAEGSYFKSSLSDEEKYWQDKLKLVTGGSKEDLKLRMEIGHELYQIHRQQAMQDRQLDEEAMQQHAKMAQGALDIQRESLAQRKAMGDISDQQYIIEMQRVADQEYAIQRDLLGKKLEMYREDKLARQKVPDDIAQLEQKHSLDQMKAQDQAIQAQKARIEQMMAPVASAVDRSVQGMIMGTTTARQAMANLSQSILAEFVSMVTKRTISWIAGEVAQTSATQTNAAVRTAASTAASGASMMASAGSAIGGIMNSAWEAMAGAYKAMVGIPYVGPFIAPVAAGGAFAAVAGMASNIRSAAGGYDIPGSVNPLTQLHAREMVLPAKYADVIRGLSEGGGGGGGASGDVHLHVHSLDAKGVQDWFRNNAHVLAPALRRNARNFAPTSMNTSPLAKV